MRGKIVLCRNLPLTGDPPTITLQSIKTSIDVLHWSTSWQATRINLTPETEGVEAIRPHIGMGNTDSRGRDGGDGDPGEYFSALLDRALCCHHEVKLVG